MIYTCTTNPSLDYYVTLPSFHNGINNRSEMEFYDAGGRGVNVSIVLNNFHIQSNCLGFLGGFTKDFYVSFLNNYPNIQPLFTTIKDNTRINVKIMGESEETSINALGPHISAEEFNKFKSRLNAIYEGDYFILSGNIQDEIESGMIEIVKNLSEDNVKIVLDTDRTVMDKCLSFKPYLVKINDSYLKEDEKLDVVCKKLIADGAKYVMYSAPHKNSYLYTSSKIYLCANQSDSLVNTTGLADSMVAGFVYGKVRGADDIESFKYANAASLATSLSNDLGSKEKIEEVFNLIEVEEL